MQADEELGTFSLPLPQHLLRRQIFQMQAQQFSAVQYPKRAPRLLQSALQAEASGHKRLGAQVAAYTGEVPD